MVELTNRWLILTGRRDFDYDFVMKFFCKIKAHWNCNVIIYVRLSVVHSHDFGDPSTTNIFLGSINPKVCINVNHHTKRDQLLAATCYLFCQCNCKLVNRVKHAEIRHL